MNFYKVKFAPNREFIIISPIFGEFLFFTFKGRRNVLALGELSPSNFAKAGFERYSGSKTFCCRVPKYPLFSQIFSTTLRKLLANLPVPDGFRCKHL